MRPAHISAHRYEGRYTCYTCCRYKRRFMSHVHESICVCLLWCGCSQMLMACYCIFLPLGFSCKPVFRDDKEYGVESDYT